MKKGLDEIIMEMEVAEQVAQMIGTDKTTIIIPFSMLIAWRESLQELAGMIDRL